MKVKRTLFVRYGYAFSVSIIALVLMHTFSLGVGTPYILFFTAVALSAYFGGFGPGVFVSFLTSLMGNFFFVEPYFAFAFDQRSLLIASLYFIQNTFLSWLIDRQHKANEEIYKQREQYHVTLSSIGDAVITTDTQGVITFMNRVAEQLTGWKLEEAKHKRLPEVFKIIDEVHRKTIANPVDKVLSEGVIIGLANHTILLSKDRREIPIDDSGAPIRNKARAIIGVVLIFRDITERRKLEQRKDDFIAVASHELKTPVTSLKIFVHTLINHFTRQGDKLALGRLQAMDKQLIKLTELITSLLDVSRIQSKKIKYKKDMFYIDDLITEVVANMRNVSDHNVIIKGGTKRQIVADRDRISQVLINLINNAIKYSPDATKIVVQLGQTQEEIVVDVKDFGFGIPKHEQKNIFERFFQTDNSITRTYPGLGLGLYISKEIIEQYNGKIWVKSQEGKGSTFSFSLPIK